MRTTTVGRGIAAAAAVIMATVTVTACSSSVPAKDASDTTVVTTSSLAPSTSAATTSAAATTVPTVPTVPPTVPPTTAPPVVPSGPVPGVVTITYAGFGGGSGESQVDWNAATGATSYRVYRGTTTSGPWTLMATYDVAGDSATTHAGVLGVGPAGPGKFTYLDLDQGPTGMWVRVIAYNANGRGPIGETRCITDAYGHANCT